MKAFSDDTCFVCDGQDEIQYSAAYNMSLCLECRSLNASEIERLLTFNHFDRLLTLVERAKEFATNSGTVFKGFNELGNTISGESISAKAISQSIEGSEL